MNMLICFLLLFAACLILSSAMGLLRFNDPMSRLHATGKIGSLVVVLILLTNLIENFSAYLSMKTGIIIVLVYYTSAHATHIIANTMLKENIKSN